MLLWWAWINAFMKYSPWKIVFLIFSGWNFVSGHELVKKDSETSQPFEISLLFCRFKWKFASIDIKPKMMFVFFLHHLAWRKLFLILTAEFCLTIWKIAITFTQGLILWKSKTCWVHPKDVIWYNLSKKG